MYKTAALMLEAARAGDGLEPCVSWGSWCTLGQTHETSHVDGVGKQARLCIYLMALQADYRLRSFLAVKMTKTEEPNGESRLMERTALAERFVFVEAAAHLVAPQEVAECSFRWSSIEGVAIEEEGEERKLVRRSNQKPVQLLLVVTLVVRLRIHSKRVQCAVIVPVWAGQGVLKSVVV